MLLGDVGNLVDDGDLWQESVDTAGVFDAVGFAYSKTKRLVSFRKISMISAS
jgi:hypothetical protein